MRLKRLLVIPLVLTLIPMLSAHTQSAWDLSIDKVTLFPLNAEVQQGQPLIVTIYVKNKEQVPFSGEISVNLYVDGFLKSGETWWFGNLSMGSVPIQPSGGYRTVVTKLDTSTLTVGIHELTVEISPKGSVDPNPEDNKYSLSFLIVPLVNPFIEAESEMLQGRENKIAVHVPNPKSEPIERAEVRLFANGSEIGVKEISIPPNSIMAAQFYYIPSRIGDLILEAMIISDEQTIGRASLSVTVRPSCDLTVTGVSVEERIFAGEPISGKLRVQNKGLSGTRANLSLAVDGEVMERRLIDFIDPGSGTEVQFSLSPESLGLGAHSLTVTLTPLDAIDLNPADNVLTISFKVVPVPVSISWSFSNGGVDVNLTNLADLATTVELSVLSNESEVRRINVTLEARESRLIPIRGLDPGNYTILAYNRGSIVASTEFEIEGGLSVGRSPIIWLTAVIPLAGAITYLIFTKRRKRKWPS